jgi:hypothetical protein
MNKEETGTPVMKVLNYAICDYSSSGFQFCVCVCVCVFVCVDVILGSFTPEPKVSYVKK